LRFGEGCYWSAGSQSYQQGADTCRLQEAEIYAPTSKEEAYWVMGTFGYPLTFFAFVYILAKIYLFYPQFTT
jgi:hypothetical protein